MHTISDSEGEDISRESLVEEPLDLKLLLRPKSRDPSSSGSFCFTLFPV